MIFIDYQNDECRTEYERLIIAKEKFIYFKYLDWDSAFFGRPSFLLDMSRSNFEPSDELAKEIEKNFVGSFITAKINTQCDYGVVFFLQQCGFYYVDTEVKLQNVSANKPQFDNLIVKEFFDMHLLPCDLLGSAFTLTRFHCDPNIPSDKADDLWVRYIKNFKPSKAKRVFVAEYGNETAGVILANISDGEVFLFFVTVLEQFRSKNIGSVLISESVRLLDYGLPICTGTQAKNISALNFYIKNGFSKIAQTNTVLHYWG